MSFRENYQNFRGELIYSNKEAQEVASQVFKSDNDITVEKIMESVDQMAAQNDNWRQRFAISFSKLWKGSAKPSDFRMLKADEMMTQLELAKGKVGVDGKTYDFAKNVSEDDKKAIKKSLDLVYSTGVNVGTVQINGLIQTNILPHIEKLVLDDSPILSKISIIKTTAKINIPEWSDISDANIYAEGDEIVASELRYRDGDLLDPKNVLAALVEVTRAALLRGQPEYYAEVTARLFRALQNSMVYQILNGNNTGNQFHGLTQVSGTGLTARGPIEKTSFVGQTPIDKMIELSGALPNRNIDDMNYTYLLNRATWYNKMLVGSKDLENRYILEQVVDGTTRRIVDGKEVLVVSQMPANKVLLTDLSLYKLVLAQDIAVLDDGGIVNFKKAMGGVLIKAEAMGDGGYSYNLINRDVAGTPTVDAESNAHRIATV